MKDFKHKFNYSDVDLRLKAIKIKTSLKDKWLSYRRETALQGGSVVTKVEDDILQTKIGLSLTTVT